MTPLDRGLEREEAARRLAEQGPNALVEHEGTPVWRLALAQFESPLVLILVAAAVVAGALGDLADAIAIAVIVLINATIGFAQERRAEQAMAALQSMTAPHAQVRRSGELVDVPASEVVVGDLLVLEAGDVVAADARVREASALATNEAPLTGESLPVTKRSEELPEDLPIAERRDLVFMGTAVASGRGVAEVHATGMSTQIGRIAELLGERSEDSTPLERRLAKVGRLLLIVCAVLVAVVVGVGALRGMGAEELFMSAVTMAVAAVPEGLPAIITIALALGMQRMAARSVLVRRLAAVETLGSVTVICTDKTGTLTTGVMSVRELWTPAAGSSRDHEDGEADFDELLWAAAACCNAELPNSNSGSEASRGQGEERREEDASQPHGAGDTTELAILKRARERGIERAAIEHAHPRLGGIPFAPEIRFMVVARRAEGREGEGEGGDGQEGEAARLWVKGAVEVIAQRCAAAHRAEVAAMVEAAEAMAHHGLRVLAIARGRGRGPARARAEPARGARDQTLSADEVGELEPLGLIGLADPPREEARAAIANARGAGVRTIMITGDHPVTAHAIARELELVPAGASDEQLDAAVRARTTAEEKNTIVRELREAGEIVAMTGDGVNDAPAIREADVGLAMGATATEVTREASDMILVDDDLSSVVTAIREGRVIYNNIEKTVVYLLSGNFSELVIMLVAAAMGLPFPLLPLHLLWINLVTEPLPGLMLVVDPPDRDVLRQPPRDPQKPLIGKPEWMRIAANALLQAGVGFSVYWWALEIDARPLIEARSLAFMAIVSGELLRSFAFRSSKRLLWQVGALRNLGLALVVLVSLGMQFGLYHLELSRSLFELAPLRWNELGLAFACGLIPVSVLELAKVVRQLLAWLRTRGGEGSP